MRPAGPRGVESMLPTRVMIPEMRDGQRRGKNTSGSSAADLRPQEQAPARLRAGLAGWRRHERDVDFHDGADGGAVGLAGEQKCPDLTGG